MRRDLLGAVLSGALASVPRAGADTSCPPATAPVENDADLDRRARLIQTGRVVPLAREMPVANAPGARRQVYELKRYADPPPEEAGCFDFIGLIYLRLRRHTHRRALPYLHARREARHVQRLPDQRGDAGRCGEARRRGDGCHRHRPGRGVLLDIAALKGGPLDPGAAITPADLVAAEAQAGRNGGRGRPPVRPQRCRPAQCAAIRHRPARRLSAMAASTQDRRAEQRFRQ